MSARRQQRMMVAAAVGVVLAACATDDAPATSDAETSEPGAIADDEPVGDLPAGSTLPPSTSSRPTIGGLPEDPVSFSAVSSVLSSSPRVDGWPLEPGDWLSTAFEPALGFRTSVPLRLIDQTPAAVRLALPDTEARARITILTPLAVGGDGLAVAVPTDFEEYVREQELIDLIAVDSGRTDTGGDLAWADFSARRAPGLDTYPCDLGDECIWIMRSEAGPDLTVIEHDPIRVAATTIDDLPFRVVASADPVHFDAAAAEALAIARSLVVLPDAEPRPQHRTLLSALGRRADTIPPGMHVAHVGDALVELSVDRPLDDAVVQFSEANALAIELIGLGNVYLVRPTGFIDPTWPQTLVEPLPKDFVAIEGLDGFLEWHRAVYPDGTTTPTTLAGTEGVEVTSPISEDVDHFVCPPDWVGLDARRCLYEFRAATGTVDGDRWISFDGVDTGRLVVFDDPFLLLALAPSSDDVAPQFTAAVQPLLDAMTITSVEVDPRRAPVVRTPLRRRS